MQKDALNNVHISAEQILITPEELKLRFPLGINDETNIAEARKTIADIVHGRDPRLLVNAQQSGDAITKLAKLRLRGGALEEEGLWAVDSSLVDASVEKPTYLVKGNHSWIIDLGSANIGNGRWLLDIDGDVDVYDVARLPGNRLKITSQATTFDCNVDDVKALGQVFITLERNL